MEAEHRRGKGQPLAAVSRAETEPGEFGLDRSELSDGKRLGSEYLVPFVHSHRRPASTMSGSVSHSVAKAAKVSWRSTLDGIT